MAYSCDHTYTHKSAIQQHQLKHDWSESTAHAARLRPEVAQASQAWAGAHLEARLDDGERQHADAGHGSGAGAEQDGLAGVGFPLQEVVLLQGVEGAEVDAHAGDAADKWLPERQSRVQHVSEFDNTV